MEKSEKKKVGKKGKKRKKKKRVFYKQIITKIKVKMIKRRGMGKDKEVPPLQGTPLMPPIGN